MRAGARLVGRLALGAMLLAGAGDVSQAAWPDKPIRLVVPFAAGGPVDVVARVVSAPLAESLGVTIVIENRPGAGGNIGTSAVARAEPDGNTLLITSGSIAVNPSLYEKVPYELLKDLEPIMEVAVSPNVFAVMTSSGMTSMADLVARAKREPGKLSYGGPGVGTQSHFAFELLKVREGIDVAHVSHNGAGPVVQSMLSGAVPIGVIGMGPAQPHIAAGTMKALSISSAKRWRDLPDVPTMVELGYKDFVIEVTIVMLAPARTPQEIVTRIARETAAALKRPDVRQKMEGGGYDITALPPDALKDKLARELKFWSEAVALTGIRMK